MKNAISILITLLILTGCRQKQSEESERKSELRIEKSKSINKDWTIEKLNKENPYDIFDTILSGGYFLSFSYFQENEDEVIMKCLTLKKGNKIIDTLNIMGFAASDKNLGYICADFNDYFAFVQSFGSGNPHEMQLIKKTDAKKLKSGYIINSITNPELLIYQDDFDNKLKIFDFENMRDVDISNLEFQCFNWQLSESLKITNVNKETISIEYIDNENNVTKKKYNR